ncbi:MAG: CehA/McbA family metallohydrolase [Rubrobacter sp.]
MCCQETETLGLPPEVIEALAHYRRLLDERGWDWGDEQLPDFFRWSRFSLLGPVFEAVADTGDWAKAIRSVIGDDVPPGIVVVRVDEGGGLLADAGPARPAIAGRTVPIDVVVDSAADTDLYLTVAGREVRVSPLGAAIETIDLDGADPVFTVVLDNEAVSVDGAIRRSAAAELRLSSPRCARWSVTDSSGGAWFPEDVLAKWDVHHRPFFHGHDVTVAVPAEPLHVVCARGLEFGRTELDLHPAAGETLVVECDPQRLFDPAADGWYGGDLHVHMNYSGDLVCTPKDAARMQLGEGLHLANLVAGNLSTSVVYDREMLEGFAGTDLPWSNDEAVARMGVEYRNDLLGHVHALGPGGPPTRYYAGHERSDQPEDWPPNRAVCEELRGLGATVGYAHPALEEFPDDWSTDRFFRIPRSVEARELVADAALGVVDSVDLISPTNDEGAVFLYHRLLSCGLRLAATAGTDAFLSFSHGPGVASNPPGWGRVYAQLGDQRLSVRAFKEAIRKGRTVVTNGPWLTFEVNGQGSGAVLDLATGDRLDVRASVQGPGAERLTLVGPDGVVAEGDAASELRFETTLEEGPTWISAVARGGFHPSTLDESVLAHTSPVYVDVAGERVARVADARWCLMFLDTLEGFVGQHGRFDPATREAHFGDLVAVLEEARSFYRRVAETADR